MRLQNVTLSGNEHGQLRPDTIYAELVHDDGTVAISATLEYILAAIRDRKYKVDGVNIELRDECGTVCSHVHLSRYK